VVTVFTIGGGPSYLTPIYLITAIFVTKPLMYTIPSHMICWVGFNASQVCTVGSLAALPPSGMMKSFEKGRVSPSTDL
jgi:hypothetical protein